MKNSSMTETPTNKFSLQSFNQHRPFVEQAKGCEGIRVLSAKAVCTSITFLTDKNGTE